MTVTVNAGIDHGPGARIDHLALCPILAAALVPGSYRVHASDLGDRAGSIGIAGADSSSPVSRHSG